MGHVRPATAFSTRSFGTCCISSGGQAAPAVASRRCGTARSGVRGACGEIASKFAVHCTQGRDYHKGAKYHLHAADNALRLSAYHEALTHCQQGLGLLAHLPATLERDRQELALRMSLHRALGAVRGQGHRKSKRTSGKRKSWLAR